MNLRNSRCPNCGYPNEETSSHCEQCGTALVAATERFNGGLAVGGFLSGIGIWIFGGLLINYLLSLGGALVLSHEPGSARVPALGDTVIALVAVGAAFASFRSSNKSASFLTAMFIVLAGGFGICSAIFWSV